MTKYTFFGVWSMPRKGIMQSNCKSYKRTAIVRRNGAWMCLLAFALPMLAAPQASTGLPLRSAALTATPSEDRTAAMQPNFRRTRAVTISLTPSAVKLAPGQTQQFSATAGGASNTAVTWALSPAVGTISSTGLYTAPTAVAAAQTVAIKATSVADPTKSASSSISLSPSVTVSLTPSAASLNPSQTQLFAATVAGTTNTAVTWSLSPSVGTISTSGDNAVYIAPSTISATQSVAVSAVSVADSSKISKSLVTLVPAILVSLTPGTANLHGGQNQQFTAVVSGTSNGAVNWSLSPATGTLSTTGLYTAPATVTTNQTVTITAKSAADPTKSATGVVSLQPPLSTSQWSIGYWGPSGGQFPVSTIQWNGLTHIFQIAAIVNADGTLNLTEQHVATYAPSLISTAHANNVKVSLTLVQSYNGPETTNFSQAVSGHLSTLVNSIMTVVNTYGYDGVDVDWEPFSASSTDGTEMATFAAALRTALGNRLLTAATYWFDGKYWTANHTPFDRINVMTYDLASASRAVHYAWFNSPLYDNGALPSLNMSANTYYLAAGFPKSKLGLGLAFYGWKWTGGILASDPTQGISGPLQIWQTGYAPSGTQVFYRNIVPLITQQNYIWDSPTDTPYLSNIGSTPSAYWYLTYDNPQSIQAKVKYILAQSLGGWIIWNTNGDYLAGNSHPHPLLDAVQAASAPAIVSASALASGTVGTAYTVSLTATGVNPLQWSLSSGSLPSGLSLTSAGVITGTPSTSGTFTFTAAAENYAGSASRSFTVTILP